MERRRRPRATIRQPAIVRQGGRNIKADILDLSESGVRFKTFGRLDHNSELQVHFRFPWSPDPLILDAMIVRKDKAASTTTFGARFEKVAPNTKLMLTLGVSKVLGSDKSAPATPTPAPKPQKKRTPPPRNSSSLSRVLGRLGLS